MTAFAVLAAFAAMVSLEDTALRLEFGEASAGFRLNAVVNKLGGETRFGDPARATPLWSVRFVRRGDSCSVASDSPAAARELVRTAEGLRFCWKGVDLPEDPGAVDVVADVRLVADGTSDWRLEIRNRSRAWAQHTVDYPILPGVLPVGEGTAPCRHACRVQGRLVAGGAPLS